MAQKKYKEGDFLGPKQIQLVEFTKTTSYGHRYANFICPDCKSIFESKIYHISSGAISRCKKCRSKAQSGAENINFKDLTGQKFGKLTVIRLLGSDISLIGRTSNEKKNIWECQCECGGIINRTTNELTSGNVKSCTQCNFNSNGEYLISKILKELNIEYIPQKTFDTCKDIRKLPFDFYIPSYNCCIEYDGTTHYKANIYGGWNTEENVLKTQKHDKIKTEWCKNNNIKLVRIPYWDLDKIDKDYILEIMG